MSDQRARRRDSGFTLVETLVTISLVGVIMATISMATIVVLRTRASSAGRANNARSEQAIGLWMPGDLASAESVDTTPGALPCGPTPACPPSALIGGSNAVMLTWTGSTVDGTGNAIATKTVVSYRVVQVNGEYQMVRVQCTSIGTVTATCESKVVLHGLEDPPPGFTFVPGVTSPAWVITVSNALAADDTSGPSGSVPVAEPGLKNKNGQRVVVTINGGGENADAGGGQQQITLSAGGTNRQTNLSTSDLSGAPTFTAARSRCGGNYAMLVDTSGSITTSQMTQVRNGIAAFINTFAGTPIKLEIVTFARTARALSPTGTEWVHYYNMLVETDVAALQALVSALTSSGNTNWEDGMFHLLKNSDGTIQANLPNTIIFFTDGVPTISRLDYTSASAAAVADPADGGLPAPDLSNFYQIGWNRAERLIRDRGGIDVIGVFVGSATATSSWKTAGAGYHWIYQVANNMTYERGYHLQYQAGNAQLLERGYHSGWEVGNSTLFERGYHVDYQRNNNVTYQIGTNNIHYQKKTGGWIAANGSGSDTTAAARTAYLTSNTTPDSTDNYRLVVDSTPTTWATITTAQYTASNVSAGGSDGVQSTVGALSGSWTTVTAAEYTAGNTTADNTDGWLATNNYTSPYSSWETSTLASYLAGNTNSASTDGWRNSGGGSSTAWTEITSAQYTASNTTADSTDGWRAGNIYAAPFSSWETTSLASYVAANSTPASTDGWRSTSTGTSTSWTDVTQAQYTASETVAGESDGWRVINGYSSPFDTWEATDLATYGANNTSSGSTDGWRATVGGAGTTWTEVTKATYDASNSTTDGTDGWQAVKSYTSPYTAFENVTSKTIKDYATLGNIVVDNTTGNEGMFVKAVSSGGHYTNAAAADLFVLPDYTQFSEALSTIALGQCGGTVTLQTRLPGGTAAQDPFTYQISSTNEIVQTSAAYRSGTFDVALPGGTSQTVTISPQDFTDLVRYSPSTWTCKSAGVAYPFTVVPVAGHAPWTSIQLNVNPNQAVSCIQTVSFT